MTVHTSPQAELRVAVVGAGIAGLTFAAMLRRSGRRVEIFEQASQLAAVGAGIQLAPNAVRVMERLGLGERLYRVGVRPRAIQMSRWDDGRTIVRMPLGEECERRFGSPYYVLHRADLHAALLQLVHPSSVHLGLRCVAIDEGPDEVELRFEGGLRHVADVVVGADGIHSRVRARLSSDRPRFSGHAIYRGVVPADRITSFHGDPRVQLWLGPHQHCVAYPVSKGTLVSFGATVPADEARRESWSEEGRVSDILAAYQGWHPAVLEVLTAADTVGRWTLHDRDPVATWSTDRVTLIGDAAHPMLPFFAQGANQAVEDAAALVACLNGAGGGSVASALRRYEEVRWARTDEVHRQSRQNARRLHLVDGEEQRCRDVDLDTAGDLRSHEWLYGYDAEAAVG
jgi:salicylate hydroxylase